MHDIEKTRFDYFAGYIVVTDVEFEAVKKLYDWKIAFGTNCLENLPDTDQVFYEASFERNQKVYKVCMARQSRMGMVCASSLAMNMIFRFRPQYIIMGGIAAGIGAGQNYGDVMLADMFWDYSVGKYVAKGTGKISYGDIDFIPRPSCIYVPDTLVNIFRKALADDDNEFSVQIGPIACGTAVVANENIKNHQVINQYTATLGLEMESYGIAYASLCSIKDGPLPVVAKSICDFADACKNDSYQKFAAYTSLNFLKFLCEKHLEDRETSE